MNVQSDTAGLVQFDETESLSISLNRALKRIEQRESSKDKEVIRYRTAAVYWKRMTWIFLTLFMAHVLMDLAILFWLTEAVTK